MDKNTAKKVKIGIGIVVIILCIGISYDALSEFANPYKTVSDVISNPERYANKQIQVEGYVLEEANWIPNTLTFVMTDGNARMKVVYQGILPRNFPVGRELGNKSRIDVVVIGTLTTPNEFKASQILVKCPSKYELELDNTS
jgi:cytochrome c-type biogenesis protein CcmE